MVSQLRLHILLAVEPTLDLQSLRLGGDAQEFHPLKKDSLPNDPYVSSIYNKLKWFTYTQTVGTSRHHFLYLQPRLYCS